MYKHGAISFLKGRPIGKGYNTTEIHGGLVRDYGFRGGLHAEVSALKGIDKADTILVIRVRRLDGELSCSKPCEKCMKFLKDKGIKKIFYSDWDSTIKEMRL